MTDREYKKQLRRIQRYIDRWHKTLGMGWWKVDYNYYDKRKEFAKGEKDTSYAQDVAARSWSDWRYRNASISFSVPKVATLSDAEVESMVVHELVHILVGSLGARSNPEHRLDHNELVVTSLTHAFLWARKEGEAARSA